MTTCLAAIGICQLSLNNSSCFQCALCVIHRNFGVQQSPLGSADGFTARLTANASEFTGVQAGRIDLPFQVCPIITPSRIVCEMPSGVGTDLRVIVARAGRSSDALITGLDYRRPKIHGLVYEKSVVSDTQPVKGSERSCFLFNSSTVSAEPVWVLGTDLPVPASLPTQPSLWATAAFVRGFQDGRVATAELSVRWFNDTSIAITVPALNDGGTGYVVSLYAGQYRLPLDICLDFLAPVVSHRDRLIVTNVLTTPTSTCNDATYFVEVSLDPPA